MKGKTMQDDYWCGHYCGRCAQTTGTFWGGLWNASSWMSIQEMKEKRFITSDLPVVEVCLIGIKSPHTSRLCCREQASCGLWRLWHQRSPWTRNEKHSAWAQVRSRQISPAQSGTAGTTLVSSAERLRGFLSDAPEGSNAVSLFSREENHSWSSKQTLICDVSWSHCPQLGVMLTHKCIEGYDVCILSL